MLALQQEVYIPKDHQLKIQVPMDIPTGETEIFLVFQPINKISSEKRVLGAFKGKISIADDFDAPLSDSFWLGNNE